MRKNDKSVPRWFSRFPGRIDPESLPLRVLYGNHESRARQQNFVYSGRPDPAVLAVVDATSVGATMRDRKYYSRHNRRARFASVVKAKSQT